MLTKRINVKKIFKQLDKQFNFSLINDNIKSKNNRNVIKDVKSIDRTKFFKKVYKSIKDSLANQFKNFNNIDI